MSARWATQTSRGKARDFRFWTPSRHRSAADPARWRRRDVSSAARPSRAPSGSYPTGPVRLQGRASTREPPRDRRAPQGRTSRRVARPMPQRASVRQHLLSAYLAAADHLAHLAHVAAGPTIAPSNVGGRPYISDPLPEDWAAARAEALDEWPRRR
jgi:hypothetical protein